MKIVLETGNITQKEIKKCFKKIKNCVGSMYNRIAVFVVSLSKLFYKIVPLEGIGGNI